MTTYSAFSYETVRLIALGESAKALTNILATNILCFALCWLGMSVARLLAKPGT